MSVCGTGTTTSSLRSFSWHRGFTSYPPEGGPVTPQPCAERIFLFSGLERPNRLFQSSALISLMRPSIAPLSWCRNLDLLSIGYAFRPHLRSRLSLGGRPFPRNPCPFGGRDSHPAYRYSYRHPHFRSLQWRFRSIFIAYGTLPYQRLLRVNPQLRYIA